MLKVGITGGIGSGKSIICNILKKWNIPIFEANLEARNIMNTDIGLQNKIKELIGTESVSAEGKINRDYIAKIIYNKPDVLEKINNLVHPLVKEGFLNWAKKEIAPYVIEEAAILFESGGYKQMDKTVTVFCEKEIRIDRIKKRNGFSNEKIEEIMRNQMSDEEKVKKADFIIYNNEKTLLLPQILNLHNKLIALS